MKRFNLIAMGASAGGIAAIAEVLSALPADLPVAVLVVQHLDPDYPSRIADILQRRCWLNVKLAEDGEQAKPAIVYIAPPDRHMLLIGEKIALMSFHRVNFSRPSIDVLFESVSLSQGSKAIGVILTGSSVDGAAGIKLIKKAGGTTIVQHPDTADQRFMPESAIATDLVDYVLPLRDIAPAIVRLVME